MVTVLAILNEELDSLDELPFRRALAVRLHHLVLEHCFAYLLAGQRVHGAVANQLAEIDAAQREALVLVGLGVASAKKTNEDASSSNTRQQQLVTRAKTVAYCLPSWCGWEHAGIESCSTGTA